MKKLILITGASGFLGSLLFRRLEKSGWKVIAAKRTSMPVQEVGDWNTATGEICLPNRPLDAVIHLAGRSLTAARWSPAEKERLRESRVQSTSALCQFISQSSNPPPVWINASGVGIYGDHGGEWIDETTQITSSFMGDMARDWENATTPIQKMGSRVALLRLSMVLGSHGGAWPRIRTPFLLGLGGPIGSGQQFWSWIHIDDAIRLILETLDNPLYSGPINGCSPNPVRNSEFTKAIAHALHRPAFLPFPAAAISILFGEMGRELFLTSQRCHSAKLKSWQFDFRYPTLEKALPTLVRD